MKSIDLRTKCCSSAMKPDADLHLGSLRVYLKEDEMRKFGNNDRLGLVRLQQGDRTAARVTELLPECEWDWNLSNYRGIPPYFSLFPLSACYLSPHCLILLLFLSFGHLSGFQSDNSFSDSFLTWPAMPEEFPQRWTLKMASMSDSLPQGSLDVLQYVFEKNI